MDGQDDAAVSLAAERQDGKIADAAAPEPELEPQGLRLIP